VKTTKHPRELSDAEAIVDEFDAADDYVVTGSDALAELRAAAAARRVADSRIEAAPLRAHRDGASWGVIGAQLGVTRQGARQRFERLGLGDSARRSVRRVGPPIG
jgi:hypothetical protein